MVHARQVCSVMMMRDDAGAIGGSASIASLLVRGGADLNVVDKDGKTALMISVVNGRQALVELLLENNADVSVKNKVRASHACNALHSTATIGCLTHVAGFCVSDAEKEKEDINGLYFISWMFWSFFADLDVLANDFR